MLAICYKKNRRSNRRARRAELHDILHSLHRGAPSNSAPPPSRGGYPAFPPAFPGAYPGFPMQMAPMAPVVSYPGPSQSTSTAVIPAGQMLQVLQRPGAPSTYGAHNTPQRTGFPGINSGVTRRAQLRAKYGPPPPGKGDPHPNRRSSPCPLPGNRRMNPSPSRPTSRPSPTCPARSPSGETPRSFPSAGPSPWPTSIQAPSPPTPFPAFTRPAPPYSKPCEPRTARKRDSNVFRKIFYMHSF